MEFEHLVDYYNTKDYVCGKLGKIYDYRYDKLYRVGCGKWHCPVCRRRKKYELFFEVLRSVYNYDLFYHFIITFEGRKLRSTVSWSDSYKFMNLTWPKFRKAIDYEFGKISYIVMPRSQRTGYCHYHLLVDREIDFEFLDKKRKSYDLGFVWIHKNQDIAEYLNKDFFKDQEWVIPVNIRHFRKSQNIKFNKFKLEDSIYFTQKCSIDVIEDTIFNRYSRLLPFEEYVKQFVAVVG